MHIIKALLDQNGAHLLLKFKQETFIESGDNKRGGFSLTLGQSFAKMFFLFSALFL